MTKTLFKLNLILLLFQVSYAVEKHLEMDYGKSIHTSVRSQWPEEQVTEKGIVIRFDNHIFPEKGTPIGKGRFIRERSKDTGMSDIYLYQREKSRGYLLNLPNGAYNVTLQFAEIKRKNAGERVFDIRLQGKVVEQGLDILDRVGPKKALDLSYPIKVDQGRFQLEFNQTSTRSPPAIAGIIIQNESYTRKINCGGKASGDYEADFSRSDYMEEPLAAGMIFDTDLLRWSGAWTGGFLELNGAAFDGTHGTLPEVVGEEVFSTTKTPGWGAWASDSKRPYEDPRETPYGPLPQTKGRYLGMYKTKEGPVLSYQIKQLKVLEFASLEKVSTGIQEFKREIDIHGPKSSQYILVAEISGIPQLFQKMNTQGRNLLLAKNGIIHIPGDDQHLFIESNHAPPNSEWRFFMKVNDDEERLYIYLKTQHVDHSKFTIHYFQGQEKQRTSWSKAISKTKQPDLTKRISHQTIFWPQTIKTKGIVGESKTNRLIVDTISLPTENPWNAWMRPGALDFFKDGKSMAVSTWSGDVWVAKGLDQNLQSLEWKRYATGLYQPLGLKIIDDQIWVQCRDQIIRLQDTNGDGEADFYQCMTNDTIVSDNFHEFSFDLQQDSQGRLYFLRGAPVLTGGEGIGKIQAHHGSLFRYDPKLDKLERIATGFRAPNGMSIGPNDEITSSDNEGNWVCSTPIHFIEEGFFYGVMPTMQSDKRLPRGQTLCFIPHEVDNSAGGQVWIPKGSWGTLSGQLIHLSYGKAKLFHVLREEINGRQQGGVIDLKPAGGFDAGIMRARFNPHDQAIYTGGLKGWQTSGVQDGGLYRVRYQEKKNYHPHKLEIGQNGIRLSFDQALDQTSALDAGNYDIKRWEYFVSKQYGSKVYKPASDRHWKHEHSWAPLDQKTMGQINQIKDLSERDEAIQKALASRIGKENVEIQSITLSEDRKSVFLEIPSIKPVMQMQTSYQLKFSDQKEDQQTIYHSIHQLGSWKGKSGQQQNFAAPKNLSPGLKTSLTHLGQNKSDMRVSLFASLYQEEHEPISPFLDAGPMLCKMEGWIKSDKNQRIQLKLLHNGQANISLNGQKLDLNQTEELILKKGYNRILLQYQSPLKGDAFFKLRWQSKDFIWEPIPPRMLFHSQDSKLSLAKQNRLLRHKVQQLKCMSCHSPTQSQDHIVELKQASLLYKSSWLNKQLQSKQPQLDCSGAKTHSLSEDVAQHIANYLSQPEKQSEATQSLSNEGKTIYKQLGCASCHTHTQNSLEGLKSKYTRHALSEYLKNPQAAKTNTSMPNFNLSEHEAKVLSYYLIPAEETSSQQKVNLQLAQKQLIDHQCNTCHSPQKQNQHLLNLENGCLSDKPNAQTPHFSLEAKERKALQSFLKENLTSLERLHPIEKSRSLINHFQCKQCHRMNGQASSWVSSDQDPKQQPPLITWAGDKLKASMLKKIIAGQTDEKHRPWMQARMPHFHQHAEVISKGLVLEQGLNPNQKQSTPKESQFHKEGKDLFGSKGFNCVICHAIGKTPALAPFGAPGIKLDLSAERLNTEYYMRWMFNPRRIDHQTLMTQFSVDNKTTGVKQILDGDAHKQFMAIYEYLMQEAKK